MELFKGIKRDDTNADLGWIQSKAVLYEDGYLKAAEILSNNFGEKPVQEKDCLIFPIIFLYRQHIEIALKSIIRTIDSAIKNKRNDKILEHHKLLILWDEMERLYKIYIAKFPSKLVFTPLPLNKEREIIKEFNKVDEDSFVFRYSTDKKGKEVLETIDYISLNHFQSQISIVIKAINNIYNTLAEY